MIQDEQYLHSHLVIYIIMTQNNNHIKAAFFDIDGTLVSFQTHRIPDSAVDALQTIHHNGIKVFIATGRPKAIINNMGQLTDKGIIDGYVTMNGAYCFVDDSIVYSKPIPHGDVLAIGNYAMKHDIPCIFVPAQGINVCSPNHLVDEVFYQQLHTNVIPTSSFAEAMSQEIYQITPFFNIEQDRECMKNLTQSVSNRWHLAFTDITAIGCVKSYGVKMMAEHFGFSNQEVICFGDGGNDVSMLEYAGIGVALGNANAEVQTRADFVTAPIDDDGVAKALSHFGLI